MSIRKAQVDFFSPMTGNYFTPSTRRDDLFIRPPVLTDPGSITDAFDKKYGVISDEEAAQIIEDQKPEVVDEVTLPVIKPEKPKPDKPKPKKPKKKKKKPVKKKTGFGQNKMRKSGVDYKSAKNVARRKKAQAMAKKRIANKKKASTTSSTSGGMTSRTGRGGRRGGSTGGSGASSKGGVSRGSRSGSPSRGGRRGGSSGGSGSSSKGGTGSGRTSTSRRASSASRSRTGRSRTRCDIRCKFDISILTNMNLVRDDLADVAYFVRTLQKI